MHRSFSFSQIPTKAKLNYAVDKATGRRKQFPLVSVENVFLFPGVPQLLRRAMDTLGPVSCASGLALFFSCLPKSNKNLALLLAFFCPQAACGRSF
jgi:hypothetical protein